MPKYALTPFEDFDDRDPEWCQTHAQQACDRLWALGLAAMPDRRINRTHTGRVVVDPDQLFELLAAIEAQSREV